ncbi:hypothetical protein LSG31_09275 [Fodinisporobacter ferrooxydans]|uniref:Uncharacterized protein n=1 Tax=Fodinisporobacter ferrooxydans TaxID=2901836 RepID=A0ABY4CPE4_9BACL|nr:hypothetical protein LSG31_09275 [Alicyclobacillaceae bacterium MYW30-H2]
MKFTEWLIALSLIVIGLLCLTMSATATVGLSSIQPFVSMLLQICLWTGIPLVIAMVVYIIIKTKNQKQ